MVVDSIKGEMEDRIPEELKDEIETLYVSVYPPNLTITKALFLYY
jgi:hypothetical protein